MQPFKVQTSVVCCFVLVPCHKVDEINEKYEMAVKITEVGPEIESLDLRLKQGEFLAEINLSVARYKLDNQGLDIMLHKIIDQYLSILPEGTTVVETTRHAVSGIKVRYTVKFYNLLMSDFSRVEIMWTRRIARIKDHKSGETNIKEFNLTTGMKYYLTNGEEL